MANRCHEQYNQTACPMHCRNLLESYRLKLHLITPYCECKRPESCCKREQSCFHLAVRMHPECAHLQLPFQFRATTVTSLQALQSPTRPQEDSSFAFATSLQESCSPRRRRRLRVGQTFGWSWRHLCSSLSLSSFPIIISILELSLFVDRATDPIHGPRQLFLFDPGPCGGDMSASGLLLLEGRYDGLRATSSSQSGPVASSAQ